MKPWIEAHLFVRELSNPPSPIASHDYELIVEERNGRMRFSKLSVNQQTEYLLNIPNPASLGLPEHIQPEEEHVLPDLFLACNLALDQACLSNLETGIPRPQVNPLQWPVTVEHTPIGPRISITATISETVHITVVAQEVLDVERVLEYFALLRRLNRHAVSTKSPVPVVNISKALSEFENAVTATNRLTIFKNLYTALLLAANWDGRNRKGTRLDAEIVSATGISASEAQRWRRIFDRTKHEDTSDHDVEEFIQGLANLPELITPLRSAAKVSILDRLHRILGEK